MTNNDNREKKNDSWSLASTTPITYRTAPPRPRYLVRKEMIETAQAAVQRVEGKEMCNSASDAAVAWCSARAVGFRERQPEDTLRTPCITMSKAKHLGLIHNPSKKKKQWQVDFLSPYATNDKKSQNGGPAALPGNLIAGSKGNCTVSQPKVEVGYHVEDVVKGKERKRKKPLASFRERSQKKSGQVARRNDDVAGQQAKRFLELSCLVPSHLIFEVLDERLRAGTGDFKFLDENRCRGWWVMHHPSRKTFLLPVPKVTGAERT
uniref:Uncharacterized protein n=1 Tax=Setaria digitata TaxID=48799 RepID=A0A915PHM8_9BILA